MDLTYDMPKIMKAYKGATRQPTIEVTNNAFKITLPNRNAETVPISVQDGPEKKILAYLTTHGSMVRSDVDTLLGVSQATSSRILKRMVSDGMIYKEGSGRRTVYRKL